MNNDVSDDRPKAALLFRFFLIFFVFVAFSLLSLLLIYFFVMLKLILTEKEKTIKKMLNAFRFRNN